MAQYTITDILGSDNIASSRGDISANFKILVDAINKTETYLNTSSTGGALTIATIQVSKYSKPITDVIFTCQASAVISGNLTIGTVGQGSTFTVNAIPTFNNDTTFGQDVTINKNGAEDNEVNINTVLKINDVLAVPATSTVSVIEDYELDTSEISSINLSWNTSVENTVKLLNGIDGQLLLIRNSGTVGDGDTLTFIDELDETSFTVVITTGTDITKMRLLVQYNEASTTWELISVIGNGVTETVAK